MPDEVHHLISTEELEVASDAVVIDCRFVLTDAAEGRRQYDAGHIPGARFADLERDLSGPIGSGCRHPLPDPDALANRLREWGVDNDSLIVCYDQNSGGIAGRLWWLVRWLGHEKVALLDGGLDAWIAAGFEVSTDRCSPDAGSFERRKPLTRTIDADELRDSQRPLLDARDAARYRGESEPFDAVAGHIPGAISAPFSDNVDKGRFRSIADLKARFEILGLQPDETVVCYCGSGVTAAHNILALKLAGFPEPVLYAGSWSDWIADPARPVATG
jgi:thiosulfate/3-mercaptopyruvate sulfurtransferase